MRIIAVSAAALILGLTSVAQAAPAVVDVTVGPQLQAKAAKTYGERDVRDLADLLRKDVEQQLAKTHAYDSARIELVLTDATPNHPTFKQLGDKPGLSSRSFGLGGAEIDGRIVSADGRETPLHHRYYETDIRNSYAQATWSDAESSIAQFARRLAAGKAFAPR